MLWHKAPPCASERSSDSAPCASAAMWGRMESCGGLPTRPGAPAAPHWTPSMLDPDRRKKMISLRLSEEEYELLKASYHTHGARNVSDLARQALHHIMTGSPVPTTGSPVPQNDFAKKLAELDDRVHALESHVVAYSVAATVKS